MSTDDRPIEIHGPPAFLPGERVRSRKTVKNDGTMWGRAIGEIVVKKGDVGYVRDVGTFLGEFYVYAIDFLERRSIVGMRLKELTADPETARLATPAPEETR